MSLFILKTEQRQCPIIFLISIIARAFAINFAPSSLFKSISVLISFHLIYVFIWLNANSTGAFSREYWGSNAYVITTDYHKIKSNLCSVNLSVIYYISTGVRTKISTFFSKISTKFFTNIIWPIDFFISDLALKIVFWLK